MAKYTVNLLITNKKDLNIYAVDEDEACQKALEIVNNWSAVVDAEVEDVEEI